MSGPLRFGLADRVFVAPAQHLRPTATLGLAAIHQGIACPGPTPLSQSVLPFTPSPFRGVLFSLALAKGKQDTAKGENLWPRLSHPERSDLARRRYATPGGRLMTFLNDISAAVVPLMLAVAIFVWKAHRWRHSARTFSSACLILAAVVAFVVLLTVYTLQQLAAYGRTPAELAAVMLAFTVGGWVAGRLILHAEPKPFRRADSETSDSITAPTL